MFSFILSLLVLSLMFSLIGGAAFLIRGTLLRGREGVMYPFWIILLVIMVFPLKVDLAVLTEPFIYHEQADESVYDDRYIDSAVSTAAAAYGMPQDRGTTSQGENPIIMKIRRIIVSSAEYVDEVSCVLFVLWFAGAMFSFIGIIVEYIGALRLMKRSSSICTEQRIDRMLSALCRRMKIRRVIGLRIFDLDSLSSPCVSGIIRPTLYIESGCLTMSDRELECVLTHELTHIRRFDMAAKLFCFFATSVHWFNPTVYRVRRTVLEDCELSCDLSVVAEYGNSVSSLYMGTILDFAERYSEGCRLICREGNGGGLFVSSPSEVSFLRRRYANMKNFRKDRPTVIITALFVTLSALANTLVLSSCSEITPDTLGSAIELTPPMDVMVRAYYDLDADDYITPEMVDGIISLKIGTAKIVEGKTVAVFTVNGDSRFTTPLPLLAGENRYKNYLSKEIERHSTDTSAEITDMLQRFHAFYCLKSIDDQSLKPRQAAELLEELPELERYRTLYVFDSNATEREYNYLCSILDASGLLEPWVIDSDEFNASSFGYFTNLTEVEFIGLTPVGYDFPENVSLTISADDNKT